MTQPNIATANSATHFTHHSTTDPIAYPDTALYIDGKWRETKLKQAVINPANQKEIGFVYLSDQADLSQATKAAADGFTIWSKTSAFERCQIMQQAASLLRQRAHLIAPILTLEQGKPLAEARAEIQGAANTIDWFAQEAMRAYGRIIPSRHNQSRQLVYKTPVGPVAAFTPWNFPINQAVRKISAALAAGCSIVIKGPEETPASCAALVHCFVDAKLPPGVLNLVFGNPANVSHQLISDPNIKKISFTGSTLVGKQLASLAGQYMKRITMELGGHAPAIVFANADLNNAVSVLVAAKFRNAGQVCIAPTRFLIEESIYDDFLERFSMACRKIVVGDGLNNETQMGPLASKKRLDAIIDFVDDACQNGAEIITGGQTLNFSDYSVENEIDLSTQAKLGYFYQPTILANVNTCSRIMNEEPFGPIGPVIKFSHYDEAIAEANRLSYGLAAYAFTNCLHTASALAKDIETGMLTINHNGLSLPETPFGGVKDSGYGSEGGIEAVDNYMYSKFISEAYI